MTQVPVVDSRLEDAKTFAFWLYVGHAASFFFSLGAFSFIPLLLNYVKRPETEGSFVHSHHTWMIRSFWYYILWCAIALALAFTIIGILPALPIFVCTWLWKAYRIIKGFIDLNNNQAMAT